MDMEGMTLPTDIKLKVSEPTLIVPIEPTIQRSMFLSNIDQVVVYPVETIYYFRGMVGHSTVNVVEKLKNALQKLLVHYDFMAGRLKFNKVERRLELDCNNAGVLFAGATSELTMEELGDVLQPNPELNNLVLRIAKVRSLQELPITTVQVSAFSLVCACLLDGIAAGEFLTNLASLARGEGLTLSPKADRSTLRARSPAKVTHEHIEYTWVARDPIRRSFIEWDALLAATTLGRPSDTHAYKRFPVSSQMLARLKVRAQSHLGGKSCSAFEALAAHFWQCRTAALDMDPFELASLLFAVDFRKLVRPPLQEGFAGNAVLSACARATAGELIEKPLGFAVEKVQEARARVTDDYVRSAIDCLEMHRGIPLGSAGVYVSAWWRIPFHTLDFGWGKPMHALPVMSSRVEFVLFTADSSLHGIDVLLAFPCHQMPKFQKLFVGPLDELS
eukprot:c15897_g1_i1 orf=322-1659(-)